MITCPSQWRCARTLPLVLGRPAVRTPAPTLQMKEAVNEEHEGKRKAELTWKINRIHWEKNRFIYDLMYQRKVLSRDLVSSTGRRDVSCQGCSSGSVSQNALARPCCVTLSIAVGLKL